VLEVPSGLKKSLANQEVTPGLFASLREVAGWWGKNCRLSQEICNILLSSPGILCYQRETATPEAFCPVNTPAAGAWGWKYILKGGMGPKVSVFQILAMAVRHF
jgi:hypothetical protein